MISRLTIAALLAIVANGAAAQPFNQFVGFGDSNIDSGFYRALPNPGGGALFNSLWPSAVANGAGKPTSSPGLMNSEALAAGFGLSGLPANQGGSNFATSGAKNVTVNNAATGGFQQAIPTTTQVANYLAANGGRANPDALYLVSSGANDVAFARGDSGAGPFPADPNAYLLSAANSLATSVAGLQAAGARYIIVPDLPFSFPLGGGAGNAGDRAARLLYSQALWSDLAAAGVNFIPADINAVRLAIVANPAAFGFEFIDTAAGHTACTQPAGVTTAWALLCSSNPAAPSHFATPTADQTRLFADDQHLSTAGQRIFSDYFRSLVIAPAQISLLAENPVKMRQDLVAVIENQIPISQRQQGPLGVHAWVAGEVGRLKIDNAIGFASESSTPATVIGGIDARVLDQFLVGIALSFGSKKPSFDTGGGFKQDEFSVSLYGAWNGGPWWADVIGTYGALSYDINRLVPIGITVQTNAASTDGSNWSFAASGGYNLTHGPLTHGPVAGITLQRVHVDGFVEAGSFTSLGFGDQTRESAVSALGYRVSLDAGLFRPFAKVVWNHELASTDRTVTAALTTISAPSYSLPAVELGKDWATATVGTAVTWGPRVTGIASFIGQIGQGGVVNYGGQVGLSAAF